MATANSGRTALVTVNPESDLFATAVEHYTRHGVNNQGVCLLCGTGLCHVRPHAASVILAAGVNPRRYDPPPRGPASMYWTREPTRSLPVLQRSDVSRGNGR
jgi:hypothetical protein